MAYTAFVEENYYRVETMQTGYDVFQFLKMLSEKFNFNKFSVLSLPTETEENLSACFLTSNWPSELLHGYDELGLLKNSPVIEKLRESLDPLVWDLEEINSKRDNDEANKAVDLFRAHGLNKGVYFPTYNVYGRRGAVSFSQDVGEIERASLPSLHLISLYAYTRLSTILEDSKGSIPRLTPRERDCLLWTAQGKTSSEVGQILDISEHTVAGYLNTLCRKLDASNKTHAVAKGLRLGLLT